MARIKGVELVTSQIGHWPDFHDFEVISIWLDRSPCQEGIDCDLRAVFYIYNNQHEPASPERRPAHAEILFHDIDELQISGFNHQNPIIGLGLKLNFCEQLQRNRLRVEWGGTGLPHEVQFRCDSLTVVRVIDLDPFHRGLRDGKPSGSPAGSEVATSNEAALRAKSNKKPPLRAAKKDR